MPLRRLLERSQFGAIGRLARSADGIDKAVVREGYRSMAVHLAGIQGGWVDYRFLQRSFDDGVMELYPLPDLLADLRDATNVARFDAKTRVVIYRMLCATVIASHVTAERRQLLDGAALALGLSAGQVRRAETVTRRLHGASTDPAPGTQIEAARELLGVTRYSPRAEVETAYIERRDDLARLGRIRELPEPLLVEVRGFQGAVDDAYAAICKARP